MLSNYIVKDLIFFENDDYIIAKKPAGLLSEEDPTGSINLRNLLETYIKQTYPWKKRSICQLVNRLDKPVTGLLICAKKQSVLKDLQNQFYLRTVRKHYFAVVEGIPKEKSSTIKTFIKKMQTAFKAVAASADDPEAKEAVLQYRLMDQQQGYSLLQIELKTGRFHQIRTQLSGLGHPIWNDEWYGAKRIIPDAVIGLFSYSIQFHDTKQSQARNFICCPSLDSAPWNFFSDELSKVCQNKFG
ncbi:MAG: RNA pseudouridine synthase [Saprospiraceae bacterium]|nr:RNA pseudouridine synthase [Saprospiraceae bacterium]